MARGPNGETNDGRELTPGEWEVLRALEREVDAALDGYRPTDGSSCTTCPAACG